MRLKDKVAIITGGANGLGFAAAKRFIAEGAKVVIADYNQLDGEKAVTELGENAYFVHVNVANRTSVDEMVEKTIEKFGHVDILINNAGITQDAMLAKMTETQFDNVIDINLKGVFNCTQAVVPYLIKQGHGKIISTSSVSGIYGNVGQTNYAATKAAIVGMTKTWAKELGRKGIQVNAVAPGFMLTDMVKKMPEKILDNMKGMTSLQALGQPEDIANAYLFLASDESNYVAGHVLHVDGGIMM